MDYLKTRAPFWKQVEKAGDEEARAKEAGAKIWVEAKSSDDSAADRWKPA
jgi:molybdopterin synthase catalytic subunit